ncbi:hypothetical protein GYA28_03250 [Candidatus Roizmanbacteria bacterium]|jgi:predicted GH43/DUF377 family glycosyl hydrolase|nr:hypothetical protein [Candidatus Roizmanbacteria bacterium]
MSLFKRHPLNPILKPTTVNSWESFAAFNGSIIKNGNLYHLFYRAMSEEKNHLGSKLRLSTIGKAVSADGLSFTDRTLFVKPEYDWEKYGCEDPRITKIDSRYFIFYTALSNYPPNHKGIKSALAISEDLKTITEKHLITPFNAKAMTIFPEKINNQYTVLLTVNTDKPPTKIAIARFNHLSSLWSQDFWSYWYENIDDHLLNLKRINSDQVEIGAPPIKTQYGWLLFHSYIKNYFGEDKIFRIETVLLDLDDPQKIIGRLDEPCLVPEADYEKSGQIKNVVFPEGALIEDDRIKIYYGAADQYCCLAEAKTQDFFKKVEINTPVAIKCQKFANNPLLQPIPEHPWESKGVFNPAAVRIDNKVFIIYRAISNKDLSTFGCAISHDGLYIDERIDEPIYKPRTDLEKLGCEDPRVTLIGNTLYLCYTAYDGKLPRLAFTAISTDDFLSRRWDCWSKPKIISPPDFPDKDGCLFPEKSNGHYLFFHRIEPNIVIDAADDLEFREKRYLDCLGIIFPRMKQWDGVKIGINTVPIKTEAGWLVFYHGISRIDRHYRVGALLLGLEDPSKVIARSTYPLLEPEAYFEVEGVVNNVVFPCGHVEIDGNIYLYYGGADRVVCGAKINQDLLIDYMLKSTTKKYLL